MLQSAPLNKYRNRKHYKPPPKQDSSANFKKLIIVIIISFVFITGQFVGGYLSHSISVISDAFHLVTDLLGFVVSFIFLWFAKKKPNSKMSFGYHRMELVGALANLFIIWALAFFFLYEATNRIINKQFVQSPLVMLIVACAGLPINIIMYFVLHSGGSHSHGLMAEPCGEQYPVGNNQSDNMCSQMICQDIQCLMTNQYQEHCHKKTGQNQQIHKHQIKVVVQGGQVKRKSSIDQGKQKDVHDHKNCKHDHDGHNHKHEQKNKDHGHSHKPGQKCSHDHNKISGAESQENIHKQQMKGHSHSHEGHSHGHGHDHEHDHGHGHGHEGHDHDHGHGHQHQSLSMKAAILHALCNIFLYLADVIQSIGLLISSLIIFFAGSDKGKQVTQWNDWHYCDPITTYIFSTIVFISTYPILKNCYYLILQSTPDYLKPDQIKQEFSKIQGVVDIHDLHIWDLRPGKTILIAHLFSRRGQEREVLKNLTDICRKKRIYHSTFQVEEEDLKDNQQYILCDHDIH